MTLTTTSLERTSGLLDVARLAWPTAAQWGAYMAQHEAHCGAGTTAVGLHLFDGKLYGVPYRLKVRAGGTMRFWELMYSQDYAWAYETLFTRLGRAGVDAKSCKARFTVSDAEYDHCVLDIPVPDYDFASWLRLSSQTHKNWRRAAAEWHVLKVGRLVHHTAIIRGAYERWLADDHGKPVPAKVLPAVDRMLADHRTSFLEASLSGVDTLIEFQSRVTADHLDVYWINSYYTGRATALNSISCLVAHSIKMAAGLGVHTLHVNLGLSTHFPYKTRLPLATIDRSGLGVVESQQAPGIFPA